MALWTPAELTTEFWLDADDASTITIATGVSNWADKSANGWDAANATGANQPAYVASALNGKGGLDFDGTNDRLVSTGFSLTQPTTIFSVASTNNSTPRQYIFDGRTSTDRTVLSITGASGSGTPSVWAGTGWVAQGTTAGTAAHVFRSVFDGASSSSGMDGVSTTGNAGTFSSTAGLAIGTNRSSNADFLDGYIHEIVVPPAGTSASDLYKIEGYLAWKWGLEANLPADHPYSSYAPITNAWTPDPADSDIAAWVDPSDTASITLSGSDITAIADQSSNANDLSNATVGFYPQSGIDTLNSRNVLTYTNDRLEFDGGDFTVKAAIMVTATLTGSGAAATISPLFGSSGTNQDHFFAFDDAPDVLSLDGGLSRTGNASADGALSLSSGTNIDVGTSDFTTSHIFYADWDAANVQVNRLGSFTSASTTYFLNGKLGEVIFFSSIPSEAVRQKYEGYLAWKWGLEANLPVGHPYELAPPTLPVFTTQPTNQTENEGDNATFTAVVDFGAATDPDFADVKFLLPVDGADASTTITDVSDSPVTFTASGNAQLDTAQSKWGGSSLLFDGSGDYVTATTTAGEYNFLHNGLEDWSFSCWARRNAAGAAQVIFDNGGVTTTRRGATVYFNGSDGMEFIISRGTSGTYAMRATSATSLTTTGVWYFVRATFDSATNTGKLYLDGTEIASAVSSSPSASNHNDSFTLGRYVAGNTFFMNGWLDDIRLTRGVIRDGTEVPTEAFPRQATPTVSGELVTNGTYDTDVSGWRSSSTSTITWEVGGAARVKRNGGAFANQCFQDLTTVIGADYVFTCDTTNTTGTTSILIDGVQTNSYTSGTEIAFTATKTTTRITINGAGTTAANILIDNVSVIGQIPTPAESNLLTNGTFDTDVSGWTTNGSSIADWVGGRVRVRRNNGAYAEQFYQDITTEVGVSYTFSCTHEVVQSNGAQLDVIIDGVTTSDYTSDTEIAFTATSTTTRISLNGAGYTLADFTLDNITVPDPNYLGGSFQWYQDGSPVGTDSDTYTVTTTLAMNGDLVYVDATNADGTTSSDSVTLTVNSLGSDLLADDIEYNWEVSTPELSITTDDLLANDIEWSYEINTPVMGQLHNLNADDIGYQWEVSDAGFLLTYIKLPSTCNTAFTTNLLTHAGSFGLDGCSGTLWANNGDYEVVAMGGFQDAIPLPTSDPQIPNALWNNGGVLSVSYPDAEYYKCNALSSYIVGAGWWPLWDANTRVSPRKDADGNVTTYGYMDGGSLGLGLHLANGKTPIQDTLLWTPHAGAYNLEDVYPKLTPCSETPLVFNTSTYEMTFRENDIAEWNPTGMTLNLVCIGNGSGLFYESTSSTSIFASSFSLSMGVSATGISWSAGNSAQTIAGSDVTILVDTTLPYVVSTRREFESDVFSIRESDGGVTWRCKVTGYTNIRGTDLDGNSFSKDVVFDFNEQIFGVYTAGTVFNTSYNTMNFARASGTTYLGAAWDTDPAALLTQANRMVTG